MTDAYRDENSRPTLICASSADGQTIVQIVADPTTHGLKVDDNTTGSDNGNNGGSAMLDQNGVPVMTALSSDGDGAIVEVYGDPATNSILIDSN